MSIGFLIDEKTPMMWRGPMVISAIKTMTQKVLWKDRDVIIIDMPPGTGDTQLTFVQEVKIDGSSIAPQVTWGTSPEMVCDIDGLIPEASDESTQYALKYMNLKPGTKITDITLDQIFIGSCTNSRIEDLREAANILKGKKIAASIKRAIVVPGSGIVSQQAEEEGLDKIFIESGFEWRSPGCSMCLAMNPDQLGDGEHCASTSNRNFEGRQGYGGRTHLVSPSTAAAAAIEGCFVDVRSYK